MIAGEEREKGHPKSARQCEARRVAYEARRAAGPEELVAIVNASLVRLG